MQEKTTSLQSLEEATNDAIEKLRDAKSAVKEVIKTRARNKLSFSRAANVAKEINDLIRVMAMHDNNYRIKNL